MAEMRRECVLLVEHTLLGFSAKCPRGEGNVPRAQKPSQLPSHLAAGVVWSVGKDESLQESFTDVNA